MKVLVLGASGFIGGAVARRLVERGDDVTVLLRDPGAALAGAIEERSEATVGRHLPSFAGVGMPSRSGATNVTVARGDLGDPAAIASAAEGVEAVVSAAGIVSPRAAPRALRWTHVAGTENVVNACRHAGVRRLVHVGCADSTLTNADRVHWDEGRHLPQPFGERAQTLALAEEIALSAELEVVALRPAWVWGPGDTSRLPSLCREALAEGGLRLCGDGETFLATVYIDNLVDVVVSALDASEASARAYYVADPEVLHAREVFRMWSEALGLPPPQSGSRWISWPLAALRGRGPAGLTPEEVILRTRSTLFDVSAAIGKLAFEPKVTFEAGARALASWAEERGGAAAIAKLERAPAQASSVDAQVTAAGGD